MRVLNLSLDNLILDPQSSVAERILDYGKLVERYIVLVPDARKELHEFSEQVQVYGSGGQNKICQLIKTFLLAKEIIKKEKIKLITVQDQYYLALVAWFLARRYHLPFEVQVHGLEKFSGLRKIIAEFVIPRATVIRVVSERLKRRLIGEFGVVDEKIMVVPIYVPVLRIAYRVTQNKEKFVFLTVGRLVKIKNIGLQIAAFRKLLDKNKNIELQIVGSGPEEENLKKIAEGVSQIKFISWQKDLAPIYQGADCFLLTSNYEGWGLVIVEAANYALPIIMTDVGCAGELIIDNQSGLIVPVGDSEKLLQAMEKIVNDREFGKGLAQAAQVAIKSLPSQEKTLEFYLENWKAAQARVESRK